MCVDPNCPPEGGRYKGVQLIISRNGRACFALRRLEGRAQLLIFVLELVQAIVDPAQGEQLLMRTLLAQFTFVENENSVGVLDGAEPVRDDQGGAALEQTVERLADQNFGFRVHARCCFVQDQKPWIVRKRPREANQLALPHGKSRAAFADVCFDAFRQ